MDLATLWFVLVAFFWGGYFLLEGFDFGVGMLLPFLPRDERERELTLETIGPVWDGNETWLVVAGGATFAAFPGWYASMFSAFYLALVLVLVFLIVRVLSFEWRERADDPRWRTVWLYANSLGSFGAAFVWGVGLSNLLYGIALNGDGDFTGSFWDLFNAYTIVGGLAVVALFAYHGATFLTLRTQGSLCERAQQTAQRLALPATALAAGFCIWTVVVAVDRNDKDVFPPVLPAALAIAALALAVVLTQRGRATAAFALTGAGTVLLVATIFTSLFPSVIVSSPNFANTLTVDGTASEHYTLAVMSVVALIVAPLVLLYQGWTYRVFRHRVGDAPVG
jgi:cytochrome bd ubiquinol oxidase subunit II